MPIPLSPTFWAYRCLQRVRTLLREREGELHRLAAALLERETLSQAEIRELLAPMQKPGLPGGGGSGGGGGGGGLRGEVLPEGAVTARAVGVQQQR
jgi:cell division protease FtsH